MVVNGQAAAALQAELTAMQQIALILASLEPATRIRVLHWASERLEETPAPRPLAAVPRIAEPAGADEALSVTTLEDLFRPVPAGGTPCEPEPAPQPPAGLLHEFVVEFQSIARDLNIVCGEQADRAADQRASSAA